MKILITNDDGIQAAALPALVAWAKKYGEVTVICPKVEQSGKSHGIEIHKPFSFEKVDMGEGVAAFALMASAGDLGASVAPQLMGVVVDTVSVSNWAAALGPQVNLSAEQIGMRTGVLVSAVFPLLGTIVVLAAIRRFRKNTV